MTEDEVVRLPTAFDLLHDVPPARRRPIERRRRRRRAALVAAAALIALPVAGIAGTRSLGWQQPDQGRAEWFDNDRDGIPDVAMVEGVGDATAAYGCSLQGLDVRTAAAAVTAHDDIARWAVVQVDLDAQGHVAGGSSADLFDEAPIDVDGVVAMVERYPAGLLITVEVGGPPGSVLVPPNACGP